MKHLKCPDCGRKGVRPDPSFRCCGTKHAGYYTCRYCGFSAHAEGDTTGGGGMPVTDHKALRRRLSDANPDSGVWV